MISNYNGRYMPIWQFLRITLKNYNRTTVACEILDLTERKMYHQNELLRKNKIEKCNQEFIITEEGKKYPVSTTLVYKRTINPDFSPIAVSERDLFTLYS